MEKEDIKPKFQNSPLYFDPNDSQLSSIKATLYFKQILEISFILGTKPKTDTRINADGFSSLHIFSNDLNRLINQIN